MLRFFIVSQHTIILFKCCLNSIRACNLSTLFMSNYIMNATHDRFEIKENCSFLSSVWNCNVQLIGHKSEPEEENVKIHFLPVTMFYSIRLMVRFRSIPECHLNLCFNRWDYTWGQSDLFYEHGQYPTLLTFNYCKILNVTYLF